jgi:hypothetical protein
MGADASLNPDYHVDEVTCGERLVMKLASVMPLIFVHLAKASLQGMNHSKQLGEQ